MPDYDLHTHSTYSDGSDLGTMVRAGAEAGLAGIGITDHCTLIQDDFGRADRFDFEETYADRRREIETLRAEVEIEIYDGVEISYLPDIENRIRAFLERAGFDYAIGSVHFTETYDFTTGAGTGSTPAAKRAAIDRYFERQVELVESDLFDIVGHVDLPNRLPGLRDLASADHYRRLAEALKGSGTVPELNAGRIGRDYGEVHPDPAYLDLFDGIPFAAATDAHRPHEVAPRLEALEAVFDEHDLDRVDPTAIPD